MGHAGIALANSILSIVLLIVVHELGHFLTSLALGKKPTLGITWNKYQVKKWTLTVPSFCVRFTLGKDFENRIIGIMGFGLSAIVSIFLVLLAYDDTSWVTVRFSVIYETAFAAHLITYPFRMKNNPANDFNFVDSDDDAK